MAFASYSGDIGKLEGCTNYELSQEIFLIKSLFLQCPILLLIACCRGIQMNSKTPSSLSKNASLKVGSPLIFYCDTKHLGLQLSDEELSTIQLTGQSHLKVGAMEGTNSQDQCISSESGIYTLCLMSLIMFCSTIFVFLVRHGY